MGQLFPAGLALGEAFYDRVEERKILIKHIYNTRHTVLIAPRRFGKTSLIKKALSDENIPHIWLDFMTINSQSEAQIKFLNHISELMVQVSNSERHLKQMMKQYFLALKPEITLSIPGLLKVNFKPDAMPQVGVMEALLRLDDYAQAAQQRVVIVCDEFQEILHIDKDAVLQASIRHAAERAQAVTYLFSGSKHQPLRRLFNGKDNPLYALCDQMSLERIAEKDYCDYLQAEAKKKWAQPLSADILRKIFDYTDYYPQYVNALCAKVWFSDEKLSVELIDRLWDEYLFSRKRDIANEFQQLTLNQRKLLAYLAVHPTQSPFSHETSVGVGLSVSAIQSALPVLIENDLVVELYGFLRVLDPTLKGYLLRF